MNKGATMKHWLLAISLTILGGSMSANAGLLGFGGDSWKEEVLLHDGKKLIVERSQTYGGYAEPASTDRSVAKEEWVCRIPGSDRVITWKSDFSRPPEGDSLMLLQLNFLNGAPYIATSPAGCLSYQFSVADGVLDVKYLHPTLSPVGEAPAQILYHEIVSGGVDDDSINGDMNAAPVDHGDDYLDGGTGAINDFEWRVAA